MGYLTKLEFVISLNIFVFFVMQISAILGTSLISSQITGYQPLTPPESPNILEAVGFAVTFVIQNFIVFFQLMTLDSTFLFFGSVILISFVAGIIWTIFEIVRGV